MRYFVLGLLVVVVGCGGATNMNGWGGPTTIDGSSEASLQASMVAITKGMTPEEKEQFGKDCIAVTVGNSGIAGLVTAQAMMHAKLDGMTLEDIRKRAEELRAESKREVEEARAASVERTEENNRKAAELKAQIAKQEQTAEALQAELAIKQGIAELRLQWSSFDLPQLQAVKTMLERKRTETTDEQGLRVIAESLKLADELMAKKR